MRMLPLNLKQLAFLSVGVIALFLGLIFLLAAVYAPTRIITGLVFMALGGFLIYRYYLLRGPEVSTLEGPILRLAEMHDGKLTPSTVSRELSIPISKAKEALNMLARKGACYIDFEEVEKVGVEVYVFPDLALSTA